MAMARGVLTLNRSTITMEASATAALATVASVMVAMVAMAMATIFTIIIRLIATKHSYLQCIMYFIVVLELVNKSFGNHILLNYLMKL